MGVDVFDFDEFETITPEDLADAEAETERRGGLLAAVLLGLWLWNMQRGAWVQDGRELSGQQERGILDDLSGQQEQRYLSLLSRLATLGLPGFSTAMGVELTRSHLMAMALGRGGFDVLYSYDRQVLEQFLAREGEFLAGLMERIAAGQSESLTAAHLRMYARHVNATFYEGRRETMREGGRTEERRLLNPAEHCNDCIQLAGYGWVEIGTLPPPGDGSQCLSNCKCDMEFR